jgi:hypothetical protein
VPAIFFALVTKKVEAIRANAEVLDPERVLASVAGCLPPYDLVPGGIPSEAPARSCDVFCNFGIIFSMAQLMTAGGI